MPVAHSSRQAMLASLNLDTRLILSGPSLPAREGHRELCGCRTLFSRWRPATFPVLWYLMDSHMTAAPYFGLFELHPRGCHDVVAWHIMHIGVCMREKKILELVASDLKRRPYPHAQIHTYLRTHTYSPAHMYTMLIHMYASTPTSSHACTYTIVTHPHTPTSTHVLAYTYMHPHIHMPTHIYIHIYTSTYTGIHTHVHYLSFFPVVVIELLIKTAWEGKAYLAYTSESPLREVRAEAEAEITEEHCSWAHSLACSASFLTQVRPTCLGMVPLMSILCLDCG